MSCIVSTASSPSLRRMVMIGVAALMATIGALASAFTAQAQQGQTPQRNDGLVRLAEIEAGALLFFSDEPGLYVPAPALSSNIDVSVAGPLARTVVTQRFRNASEVFVEGKYVFPLPEGAAVDTLKMRIGERLIEGEIKERQEAKKIYERAKAEGFKASLVEQERPNMFTTSVANIGPNEVIVIQIEYQESIAPRDGAFGLRLPLVVAPRYSPKPQVQAVKFGPNGWELDGVDPVPDRDRISPPVVDPREEPSGALRNPVTITVDLAAGFPLGEVKSLNHEVSVVRKGETGAEISLQEAVAADRDFLLSWKPKKLEAPYMAVFEERKGDEAHLIMMLTPPALETLRQNRAPREVVFVQDISGSMQGESIEQARAGLEMALRRLEPEDYFNIIVFNDEFGLFADKPMRATRANVNKAVRAVRALKANGGTEMLPALEAALLDHFADGYADDESRVRQVIFLTDGAVGNEREMLRLIERDLGRSRLFTVGIGSAPNSYFMTAAAESGRGTHVFISALSEVGERMEQLFAKIETPAMTDLSLKVAGYSKSEIWPNPLPDLYAGDSVVATIRLDANTPTRALPALLLGGQRAGEAWESKVDLRDAEQREGVSKLWARQRIKSLEAFRLSPDAREAGAFEAIDKEILQTALEHHLVSRLTSLVAVDVTPSRPTTEPLVSRDVPLAFPDGWDPSMFDAPQEAPGPDVQDAQLGRGLLGFAQLPAAAQQRLEAAAQKRRALQAAATAGAPPPVGGVGWRLTALIGAAMMLLSVVLMLLLRRRTA